MSAMSDTSSIHMSQPPSKASLTESTDSGYASATTNTPERVPLNISRGELELSTGNIFKRKITNLKVFDHEIPTHVQDRFLDLNELFEKPLYEYLIKTKVSFGSISTRLKVLGEDEATAVHWIVVLCEQKVVKRVKQFFNQPHIKSEYQPRIPTSTLPFFRIWVCNRPPRPIAGYELLEKAYGESVPEPATLCGSLVRVQDSMATLGGIINVTTLEKGAKLYGMTAEHMVIQGEAIGPDFSEEDIGEDDGDQNTCNSFDEEDFELDSALGDDENMHEIIDTNSFGKPMQDSGRELQRTRFTQISVMEYNSRRTIKNLDWALVDIGDLALSRPNLLVLADGNNSFAVGEELKETSRRSMKLEAPRTVVIMSGTNGARWGQISTPSSFLMAGSARTFTQTYIVKLYDGLSKIYSQHVTMLSS